MGSLKQGIYTASAVCSWMQNWYELSVENEEDNYSSCLQSNSKTFVKRTFGRTETNILHFLPSDLFSRFLNNHKTICSTRRRPIFFLSHSSQGLYKRDLLPPLFYSVTGKEGTAGNFSLQASLPGWDFLSCQTSMLKEVQLQLYQHYWINTIYIILFAFSEFQDPQVILIFVIENTKAQREVNLFKIIYLRSSGAGIQTPVVLPHILNHVHHW